jgi:hypothetical protein
VVQNYDFGKHLEKAGRQKISLKQKKKGHV